MLLKNWYYYARQHLSNVVAVSNDDKVKLLGFMEYFKAEGGCSVEFKELLKDESNLNKVDELITKLRKDIKSSVESPNLLIK